MDSIESPRRMRQGLAFVVVLGGSLLATHRGEFWPFSTYPMFSRAGKRWQRALVREDDGIARQQRWQACTVSSLPGKPFGLRDLGLEPTELSGFFEHTTSWDPARQEALRAKLAPALHDRRLIVYLVTPGPQPSDAVATPVVWIDESVLELGPDAGLVAGAG